MNPEDAEEYTQALGQITAGAWRQIALANRLGVPQALGLTTEEWVRSRLGGYVRLSPPERREAVAELTAEGLSQRQVAQVLGVDHRTVGRTLGADAPPGDKFEVVAAATSGADAPPDCAPDPVATAMDWTQIAAQDAALRGGRGRTNHVEVPTEKLAVDHLKNLRFHCYAIIQYLQNEEKLVEGIRAGGSMPPIKVFEAILSRARKLSEEQIPE